MTGKLADAADKMSEFLTATVSMLSASVQQSVKHITDKVNDQQAGLLALQEGTTLQPPKLLDSFNAGLERLEKMNEHIAATMNEFRLAQGEITASTSNLRTICGDMKLATKLFSKGLNDSANKLTQLQMTTQKNIGQIAAVLQSAGLLSEEYMRKFETIKNMRVRDNFRLKECQLRAVFDMHRQSLRFVVEEAVCGECRTDVHDEVVHRAVS